jgi:hypothetical protein
MEKSNDYAQARFGWIDFYSYARGARYGSRE